METDISVIIESRVRKLQRSFRKRSLESTMHRLISYKKSLSLKSETQRRDIRANDFP